MWSSGPDHEKKMENQAEDEIESGFVCGSSIGSVM